MTINMRFYWIATTLFIQLYGALRNGISRSWTQTTESRIAPNCLSLKLNEIYLSFMLHSKLALFPSPAIRKLLTSNNSFHFILLKWMTPAVQGDFLLNFCCLCCCCSLFGLGLFFVMLLLLVVVSFCCFVVFHFFYKFQMIHWSKTPELKDEELKHEGVKKSLRINYLSAFQKLWKCLLHFLSRVSYNEFIFWLIELVALQEALVPRLLFLHGSCVPGSMHTVVVFCFSLLYSKAAHGDHPSFHLFVCLFIFNLTRK